MIEIIFICSMISAIFSAFSFIRVMTIDNVDGKRIARLMYQVKELKEELSRERAKRIKAESDAAYFQDYTFPNIEDLLKPF